MQSNYTSPKLLDRKNIISFEISDLFEDLHFKHSFLHLEIRGLDFKKLINVALNIYITEGYKIDEFTLNRLLRDYIDKHCLDYFIVKEQIKPQLKELKVVITIFLDMFSSMRLSTEFSDIECYHCSRTTVYIKGIYEKTEKDRSSFFT